MLASGTCHRVDAAEPSASAALWLESADGGRHRLRFLSTDADAGRPLEGEFTERVGSARFASGGCTFEMSFAPDLIVISGAGAACGQAVNGNYLRTAGGQ